MKALDTNKFLQQLKRAYAERVVLSGFDDVNLYNDALLRLDDLEIEKFQMLNGILSEPKENLLVNVHRKKLRCLMTK